MENNENNIAGYCFKDEELYNRAKKEIKSLEQIDASLKGKKTEEILEIYKDVNEKELFKTPIGIEYLKMVRNRLKKSPMIKNDDIFNPEKRRHKRLSPSCTNKGQKSRIHGCQI